MNKLVKKAQKGDDEAFLQLFQIYESDIYRTAFIYVKNENDALDVVQETAYRSFKKLESLKNPKYFKTWLTKIAINCSLDVVKKNQKVVQLRPEYEEMIRAEENNIPLSLSLQDLVDGLKADEKSIVILKYYQNLTFEEIADILDIPLGSAKSVLYRALKKLKHGFLKEEDVNG